MSDTSTWRRPGMAALALATLVTIAGPGCRSGRSVRPVVDDNLRTLVRDKGFKKRRLFSGHRGAGTILMSLDSDDVFMTAEELGVKPRLEEAVLPDEWKEQSSFEDSLKLSLLGFDDAAKQSQVGAQLKDAGVSDFTVKFGNAWEESVSTHEILSRVENAQGSALVRARNAIENGQPVIVRALRVDSITVSMNITRSTGGEIDTGILAKLIQVDASTVEKTKSSVRFKKEKPVYIGYTARPLKEPPPPPPSTANEVEPNNDFSSATPMRPNGSAVGRLAQPGDPVDMWVIVPPNNGQLTISCRTTSGKRMTVRYVQIFDASGGKLDGKKKPFRPNKTVKVGSYAVQKGSRYYVAVKPRDKAGTFASYVVEASFSPF